MLRAIVAWLSKRFPEQHVVSVQEWTEMRQELGQYNNIIQGVNQMNERVVSLEAQIRKLNDANGFVSSVKGSFKLER
jgi:hypothetical protein